MTPLLTPSPSPWAAHAPPSPKLTLAGLPLSPTKPPPNAFDPLLERARKLLTGWQAKLLDKGNRLILISGVLDSLLTYFMSIFRIPKKVLKTLDSLRGAFFWAGEDSCSGAQCLIAWENMCPPKIYGGLGLKNLHTIAYL